MDDPSKKKKQKERRPGSKRGKRKAVDLDACGVTAQDIRRIVAKLKEDDTRHDGEDISSDS